MSYNVIKLLPNSYPKISKLLIYRLHIVLLLCLGASFSLSQTDQDFVLWQHAIGGAGDDQLNGMVKDADGNLYVVGSVQSSEQSSMHAIVTKYARGGVELWSKRLDEFGDNRGIAIELLNEHVYVLLSSNATAGQLSDNEGREDILLLQLSVSGELVNQTHFGGNHADIPTDLTKTANGELLISAQSQSTTGFFGVNKGQSDMWVFRVTGAGELLWKKNYGGSEEDYSARIAELPNGEIVLLGHSSSYDGDVGVNYGDFDLSLFKLTSAGVILWEHNYGGYQDDLGVDLLVDETAQLYVAGNTLSNSLDIGKNAGFSDAWLLKINPMTGAIVWEETHGSVESDHASFLSMDANKDIYLMGTTTAASFEGEQSNGVQNVWLAHVNAQNSLDHIALFGGNGYETVQAFSMESDGSLLVLGSSTSTTGLMAANHGKSDGCLVNFKRSLTVDSPLSISLHPNPTSGLVYLNNLLKTDVISVVNAMGQSVVEPFSVSGFSEQLDLTGLVSGVYLLQISRGTSTEVIRVVRN
jgi:hypothetical protein